MSAEPEPDPRGNAPPAAPVGSTTHTPEAPAVSRRSLSDRQGLPPRLDVVSASTQLEGLPDTEVAERQAVGEAEVVEEVRRAQEGSAQAFASLYDRYVGKVYGFVYHRVGHRQTAEDLVSDVFLRALRRIDTFTWQGTDFGAWLVTIARNRVNDYFKSARFRLEAPVEEVFDTAGTSAHPDDPESAAMTNEVAAHVHDALSHLKDEHAEVLYLRFIQHLSVAETGAVLGKSESAVKALQYRALKALARLVPEELTR